jgi:hypothetical protein
MVTKASTSFSVGRIFSCTKRPVRPWRPTWRCDQSRRGTTCSGVAGRVGVAGHPDVAVGIGGGGRGGGDAARAPAYLRHAAAPGGGGRSLGRPQDRPSDGGGLADKTAVDPDRFVHSGRRAGGIHQPRARHRRQASALPAAGDGSSADRLAATPQTGLRPAQYPQSRQDLSIAG